MNPGRYHLAVVGAGSAGLASAALAAELGARVALIERHRLGGDRLRYRFPAAALIRAARDRAARYRADRDRTLREDFTAIWKRARRQRAADATDAESLRRIGVDIYDGEARFVAADAVEIESGHGPSRRLEFRRALIATGARTAVPRIPGLDAVAFRTPETLFEMTSRPCRFAVLGAGSRGCEMAQAFADLGHLAAARAGALDGE